MYAIGYKYPHKTAKITIGTLIAAYIGRTQNHKSMTDKLQKWLENGANAEMGAKLIAESMEGNYQMKRKGVEIMLHPRFGTFAITKYGTIFFVPNNIERIAQLGDDLYIYTHANWIFVYDLSTGELKDIAQE